MSEGLEQVQEGQGYTAMRGQVRGGIICWSHCDTWRCGIMFRINELPTDWILK